MDESESRFRAYLEDHGYEWRFEPDYEAELSLPVAPVTTPDFLVSRDDKACICEVRQFTSTRITDRLDRSGGTATLSDREVYGTLRYALVEKADQLAPFAQIGLPLVIVVSNPLGADVGLDSHHVSAAMFGNPRVVMPISRQTGAAVGPAEYALEDYGVFASPDPDNPGRWINRHRHVSAVAVLHHRDHAQDWREDILARYREKDRTMEAAYEAALAGLKEINERIAAGEEPEGGYEWLEIFATDPGPNVPLHPGWFQGPRGKHFGFTAAGGYAEVPSAEVE